MTQESSTIATEISITLGYQSVNWEALQSLIYRGFEQNRSIDTLTRIFSGSFACCFAWDREKLVGAARAISDGVSSSAIYDVVVDPAYQGKGIGRRLMDAILEQLPKRSVMLVSTHGNEQFYRKLGFRKLRTAYILQDDFRAWEVGGYFDE